MANNYTQKNKNLITQPNLQRLHDYLKDKKFSKKRIHPILQMRLRGKTLDAIGDIFVVSRERIRQQEAMGVEIIRHMAYERK